MIASVALNARGVRRLDRSVCIVVDVLRASSTMLAMFEAGASELVLAESPESALAMTGDDRAAHWVCGERDGLKCEGFDYGNSPTELVDADLGGRRVIYVTSNGTNALRAVASAPLVLVGSPRNEVAVVRLATREAMAHGYDVLILCAGDDGGYGVSLEDTFCAGMLVERMVKLSAQRVTPDEAAGAPEALALDDSAIVAHRLFWSYRPPGDGAMTSDVILRMFAEARSGRDLPSKGFAADLEYCAEVDVSTVVPRLGGRTGALAVVAHE